MCIIFSQFNSIHFNSHVNYTSSNQFNFIIFQIILIQINSIHFIFNPMSNYIQMFIHKILSTYEWILQLDSLWHTVNENGLLNVVYILCMRMSGMMNLSHQHVTHDLGNVGQSIIPGALFISTHHIYVGNSSLIHHKYHYICQLLRDLIFIIFLLTI